MVFIWIFTFCQNVIIWHLPETKMAQFTRESIDDAIVSGNLDYIQDVYWVTSSIDLGKRDELFDADSSVLAAKCGRTKVLRFLGISAYRCHSDTRVLQAAAESGNPKTFAFAFGRWAVSHKAVKTVVAKGFVQCTGGIRLYSGNDQKLLRELIDIAVENGHDSCADYLRVALRP